MSINLNDSKFQESKIFNNGKAGLVTDVTLSVAKKTAEDHEMAPDYKLIVTDSDGSEINAGFYYFKPRDGATQTEVESSQGYEVGRYVHLARAVMGEDYVLPEVNSVEEALDVVMKLVMDNAGSKKFNVYTNYGTVGYPKQYLQVRRYNFVEPADVEVSRLRANGKDILTPVTPDSTTASETAVSQGWS